MSRLFPTTTPPPLAARRGRGWRRWGGRDPQQVHVRGCWVVDLVLGKS